MIQRIVAVDYGLDWDFYKLHTREETDSIIIHHTAGLQSDTARTIHEYHKSKEWAGIGYHYLVGESGLVEIGRPRDAIGAHAAGHNSDTVGIALIGNYNDYEPSRDQIENLAVLIANICYDYNIEPCDTTILGHRDVDATACPGTYVYHLIPDIIGKAIFYMEE